MNQLKNNVDYELIEAPKHNDERGSLVDFLKRDELEEEYIKFGQMYYVTFDKPEAIRGNHFHKEKDEWFVVGSGTVKVTLEDVETKLRASFILDGDGKNYTRLRIKPNIAHSFKNITENAIMINYASKPYSKENPDTYDYKLV